MSTPGHHTPLIDRLPKVRGKLREGAQLAKEIGPTIFRKLKRNKFPLMFNIKRLRACGIFSKDITHDIHIEQVTKSKTMELVFVELKIILDSSLILISL